MLERAIAIAAEAHTGQLDKAGVPYILHPLRVMLRLERPEERIAGVLHDVLEDSPWTLEALRGEGFSEEVIEAVEALTRREGESYADFVRRAARNPIARQVKIADLLDNLDSERVRRAPESSERLERYRQALTYLQRAP